MKRIRIILLSLLVMVPTLFAQRAHITVTYGGFSTSGTYEFPQIPEALSATVKLWGAGGRGGQYQCGVTCNDIIYFGGGGGGAYSEMYISGTSFDIATARRSIVVAAGASEKSTTFAGSIVANSGKNGGFTSSKGAAGGTASSTPAGIKSYRGGNGGKGIEYKFPSGGYKGGQGGQSAGLDPAGLVPRTGADGGDGLISDNRPKDWPNYYIGTGGGGATTTEGADHCGTSSDRWPGGGGGGGKTGAFGIGQHSPGKGGNGRVMVYFEYPQTSSGGTLEVSPTIPSSACYAGAAITLTLSNAGDYTDIKWYKDGMIQSAANNKITYDVTGSGEYYVQAKRTAKTYEFPGASVALSNGGGVVTQSGNKITVQSTGILTSRTIKFVASSSLTLTFGSEYSKTVTPQGLVTVYCSAASQTMDLNSIVNTFPGGASLRWQDANRKVISSNVSLQFGQTTFYVQAVTTECESQVYTVIVNYVNPLSYLKVSIWSPNWVGDRTMTNAEDLMNWNDKRNWVNGLVPTSESTVYIPGYRKTVGITGTRIEYFPKLNNTGTFVCKDIFLTWGAELTQPQYLQYGRAFVQMDLSLYEADQATFTQAQLAAIFAGEDYDHLALSATLSGSKKIDRNCWHLLSPAINGMSYAGDYSFGGVPATYIRVIDADSAATGEKLRGKWGALITAYDHVLPTANGFAFWANSYRAEPKFQEEATFMDPYLSEEPREVGLKGINGVMEFPWIQDDDAILAHRVYQSAGVTKGDYYPFSGNDLLMSQNSVRITHGNPNKFVFEPGGQVTVNVKVVLLDGKKVALLGNPYVATLDFDKFQEYYNNVSRIKKTYTRWTGLAFESYGSSTFGPSKASKYIAPMEGFYVEFENSITVGSIQTLIFDAVSMLVPHPIEAVEEETPYGIILRDIEGNTYTTGFFEEAGWWMTENLATKYYADGMPIATLNADPEGTNNSTAYLLTAGLSYFPLSESAAKDANYYGQGVGKPGFLYSWKAATRGDSSEDAFTLGAPTSEGIIVQGVCPRGWHVPNDYEWSILEKVIAQSPAGQYSSADAVSWDIGHTTMVGERGWYGYKMKSKSQTSTFATFGSSLSRSENGFSVLLISDRELTGMYGDFWTSSAYNSTQAWTRGFGDWNYPGVTRVYSERYKKYPIRCKRNDTKNVRYETSTLTDYDGNTYTTAKFGDAGWWMTENLATTHYSNGANIATGGVGQSGLGSSSTGSYVDMPINLSQINAKNSSHFCVDCGKPGLLYSWTAATNRAATSTDEGNLYSQTKYQGACPTGWHLPSDYEWNQLEAEIAKSPILQYSTSGGTAWNTGWNTQWGDRGVNHGAKMRSTYHDGASNDLQDNGFGALMVGYSQSGGSSFTSANDLAGFWASSSYSSSNAYLRELSKSKGSVGRVNNALSAQKGYRYSVRCKKDTVPYEIGTLTDIEGNVYTTAKFGDSGWWMTQNLATNTYADGTIVPVSPAIPGTGLPLEEILGASIAAPKTGNGGYHSVTIAEAKSGTIGLLYTWAAATRRSSTSSNESNSSAQVQYQGMCPNGWHIPSDYEWNQLEKAISAAANGLYASAEPVLWNSSWDTQFGGRGSHAGKMVEMSYLPESSGNIVDENGFGLRDSNYANNYNTWTAKLWTSSSYNSADAIKRRMSPFNLIGSNVSAIHPGAIRGQYAKTEFLSVRCKKN